MSRYLHSPLAHAPITSALAVALSLALTVGTHESTAVDTHRSPDAQAVAPSASGTRRTAGMTLSDVLKVKEIIDPRVSPDGRAVAFIIKQALLERNEYGSALCMLANDGKGAVERLAEGGEFSQLRWSPDGRHICYLSSDDGNLIVRQIDTIERTPSRVLLSHQTAINRYEWSPDGKRIVLVASGLIDREGTRRALDEGLVYDDESLDYRDILAGSWLKSPTELWLYQIQTAEKKKLWENGSGIGGVAWSPDGSQLAVAYQSRLNSLESRNLINSDIAIISASSGERVPVLTSAEYEAEPSWSPDGRTLAFIRNLRTVGVLNLEQGRTTDSYGQTGSTIRAYWWNRTGTGFLFEGQGRRDGGLYSVGLKDGGARKLSAEGKHLSSFSLDRDRRIAFCISQDLRSAPELAVMALDTGVPERCTFENEEYSNLVSDEVEELVWRNKFGQETNAFLIKPVEFSSGRSYPLLVILYGFERKFISQAQWIASYPAQVFASEGFAVLLMNCPPEEDWRHGDFVKAAKSQFYGPLASIEKVVGLLVDRGVADPAKKGILGWSYGSSLTDFTITHSSLFEAASSGEGGLLDPGSYWLIGNKSYQDYMEGAFGGPPYGEWYRNYKEISPSLNAHRVRIPVMLEYSSEVSVMALEFFTALKRHGAPVELVIYPGAGHILSKPSQRFYSMRRNLDWFSFWLLDKEFSDPSRAIQYRRWNGMKRSQGRS